MLVYPGENHSLGKEENQVDYHYRVLEWFGHYLKEEDAKKWITEGKSYLDRQKELEDKKEEKSPARDHLSCPKCNAKLHTHSKFCNWCGTRQ